MIVFASEAILDFERLHRFLEIKDPNAAARAMRAIGTKLELLEHMPGLGRKTASPSVRKIAVKFGSWGYVVRYSVREPDGALVVLRIWHGRELR